MMTTKVDYEKFPPQKAIEKSKAKAEGSCFKGLCTVIMNNNAQIILFSDDAETLLKIGLQKFGFELDAEGFQKVAIFSQDNVKEVS
jgi:hypothetical protein